MKTLLLISLTLVLTGCISTEHSSESSRALAANPDGLICKTEKPTGSHRPVKVCRTVGELERDKKEVRETTRRVRNQAQISRGG
tara:strand:- start:12922 stop:13173 length:252 start_codon:yes stop_codon:yes gene_type:complete